MSDSKALTPIAEEDYEAIEGAVMETYRGRWFLKEYARRNRAADTQMLLHAIERLEGMVVQSRETQEKDRLRMDLMEMARAISRTKSEIASLRPQGTENNELGVASEALDAIVRTTERATSDILEAAEHVQEAAWTLREEGANDAMCDELDRRATDIYTACSFQDLTAQRTTRIVNTLRYLEGRIEAMIEIWGEPDGEGETEAAAEGTTADATGRARDLSDSLDDFNGLCQDGIDGVIIEGGDGDPVDAYFFERGESVDPVEIVSPAAHAGATEAQAGIEVDPVLLADDIAVINTTVHVENGPDTGLVSAEDIEDATVDWQEVDPQEEETEADNAQGAGTRADSATPEVAADAGAEAGAEAGIEVDTEAKMESGSADVGPLPELDALETREKLRRFS